VIGAPRPRGLRSQGITRLLLSSPTSITLIIGPSKPRPGTRIIAGRKLARDPAPRVLFGTCLGPARATAEAYESISPFGSTALRRGCRDRVPFGTGGLGAPVSVR
jgi:hypothetical protein